MQACEVTQMTKAPRAMLRTISMQPGLADSRIKRLLYRLHAVQLIMLETDMQKNVSKSYVV